MWLCVKSALYSERKLWSVALSVRPPRVQKAIPHGLCEVGNFSLLHIRTTSFYWCHYWRSDWCCDSYSTVLHCSACVCSCVLSEEKSYQVSLTLAPRLKQVGTNLSTWLYSTYALSSLWQQSWNILIWHIIFSPPCAHTNDGPSALKDGSSSNLYYSEQTILCNVQAQIISCHSNFTIARDCGNLL